MDMVKRQTMKLKIAPNISSLIYFKIFSYARLRSKLDYSYG